MKGRPFLFNSFCTEVILELINRRKPHGLTTAGHET